MVFVSMKNEQLYEYQFVNDKEGTQITCPCGAKLQANGIDRHYETAAHLAWEYQISLWSNLECGCGGFYDLKQKQSHLKCESHKEWVKKQLKLYSSRKVICCCGATLSYKSLCGHRSSKAHLKWVENGGEQHTETMRKYLQYEGI